MAETTKLKTRVILRNDSTANWEASKSTVLLKGEVGIEFTTDNKAKIKVGDGVNTWENLPYLAGEEGGGTVTSSTQVFEATPEEDESDIDALTRVVGGTPLQKGDIGIVGKVIAADKKEYTAYVYNGTNWAAMDGNYNAENVYFDSNLTITADIGVQTVTSGSKELQTTGKNLKQVLDMIMAQEQNPKITQPSVSITCTQMGNYEVGSKVTPQWSVTLNPGSYSYGPATGVTATSYSVSDTDSNSAETASGSFPELTVEDGENYSISATVQHSAGAVPKTNLGNDYAAGKIAEGSKSSSKGTITGHRKTFYGTTTDKGVETTSAIIRGLSGKSNVAFNNGSTFKVSIPVGALRVLIAYPATLRDVTSIKDDNAMSAEIKTGFTLSTVAVEGANNYTATNYKVYTMDFANANDTANTYTVTI